MTIGENMPQRRTAIKDLRKSHTRHLHNLQIKTDLKKAVKRFNTAAADKKADPQALLKEIYKKFDKAAKRKIMHKKTAARRKARFAKSLAAK
jgi:small subunit ribosomal protein S20